jgi:hypothetical protein
MIKPRTADGRRTDEGRSGVLDQPLNNRPTFFEGWGPKI